MADDEENDLEVEDGDELEPDEDDDAFDDEIDDDIDVIDADDELEDDVDVVAAVDGDDGDDDADDDADEDEGDEALDELEAEELELVDDEVSESLLVDEVAELRAIRREELTLNVEAQAIRTGEFVCQSCFLVKRTSQLANRKKMICADCAA